MNTFNQLLYDIEKYKLNERCDRFASVFESVLSPAFEESWGEFKSNVSGKKWYQKIIEFIKFIGRKIKEWFKGILGKISGNAKIDKETANKFEQAASKQRERTQKANKMAQEKWKEYSYDFDEESHYMDMEEFEANMDAFNKTWEKEKERLDKEFEATMNDINTFRERHKKESGDRHQKFREYIDEVERKLDEDDVTNNKSTKNKTETYRMNMNTSGKMAGWSISAKMIIEKIQKGMETDLKDLEVTIERMMKSFSSAHDSEGEHRQRMVNLFSNYYSNLISELEQSNMKLLSELNKTLLEYNIIEKV